MGNGVFEFSHKKALSEVKLCIIYNQKVLVDMVQWLSGHGVMRVLTGQNYLVLIMFRLGFLLEMDPF